MVYRKYRALAHSGRENTRIFKTVYRNQFRYRMPAFKVPEALQNLGVVIHNPTEKGFFDKPIVPVPEINHPMFKKPTDQVFFYTYLFFQVNIALFRIIHCTRNINPICLKEHVRLVTALIKHVH
jgi:hypothetical protein